MASERVWLTVIIVCSALTGVILSFCLMMFCCTNNKAGGTGVQRRKRHRQRRVSHIDSQPKPRSRFGLGGMVRLKKPHARRRSTQPMEMSPPERHRPPPAHHHPPRRVVSPARSQSSSHGRDTVEDLEFGGGDVDFQTRHLEEYLNDCARSHLQSDSGTDNTMGSSHAAARRHTMTTTTGSPRQQQPVQLPGKSPGEAQRYLRHKRSTHMTLVSELEPVELEAVRHHHHHQQSQYRRRTQPTTAAGGDGDDRHSVRTCPIVVLPSSSSDRRRSQEGAMAGHMVAALAARTVERESTACQTDLPLLLPPTSPSCDTCKCAAQLVTVVTPVVVAETTNSVGSASPADPDIT